MSKHIVILAGLFAVMVFVRDGQRFTGVITDSACADGNHARMQMGSTDSACTKACIDEHGATYVLWDGKQVYDLDDQKTPEKFAGKKVIVTGALDPAKKAIQVRSIEANTSKR